MNWVLNNVDLILTSTALHIYQSVLPLVFGIIITIPLAQLAKKSGIARAIILPLGSLLFTIPSLALLVVLPAFLRLQILDPANVIVALTIYAVALLVRTSLDALNSIDNDLRQAAVAMGYRPVRRFFTVDLPLSIPVLFSGLRVVSVSNISLVSVGALIGVPSLGTLFTDGLTSDNVSEVLTGIVMILILALLMDLLLVGLQRLLTPWLRTKLPSQEAPSSFTPPKVLNTEGASS
ncbi:Glycine betaine transport system permease protein [Renibacterium salmoninarum ATCC 33209]|uniref:Glycine betaine transport system permease protein n=1 Tax=Renibacterium salmoninarum (strain ATCC 33209 / DSM 20767 / JCM 11484 / NBRC 15589 / NCIMB 2235) TaxID=288705 RepID=A9WPC6_RENSM|nr:ABC transporter permease subunit [Renibacterium salmoninarum]ABY22883.1 Glycine betaine transport system permease protein [Renibacterium salmoninarum ATCC 33209]